MYVEGTRTIAWFREDWSPGQYREKRGPGRYRGKRSLAGNQYVVPTTVLLQRGQESFLVQEDINLN
jgi:hypothetical protein